MMSAIARPRVGSDFEKVVAKAQSESADDDVPWCLT
jgi:hypothetical protein